MKNFEDLKNFISKYKGAIQQSLTDYLIKLLKCFPKYDKIWLIKSENEGHLWVVEIFLML